MATNEGILAAWRVIEAAGIPRPALTEEEADRSITVWSAILADIDDNKIAALTLAWLRSEETKFGRWPTPGALLHAIPDPSSVDDSEEAWGEILSLLASRGRDNAPTTTDELEDLRGRLRAAYTLAKERGDTDRMKRIQRNAETLPRVDAARTDAMFAAVRAVGGFRRLGVAEDGEMVSHRAAFRAAYKAHRQRKMLADNERAVSALLGSHLKLLPGGNEG